MTGRRGRRRKQLLDVLKERRRYWKLKEEALDRTLWRSRFGRGYRPVVRQTTELMNWVKRPGCEAHCSPPSSTKVKKAWSYTSAPTHMPSWLAHRQVWFYLFFDIVAVIRDRHLYR
jgi:hypothetical protein